MDLSGEGGLLVKAMTADSAEQLEFLNNLQRILNEGTFVASYKYALVHVLADLCVERSPAADGRLTIPLDTLSERFIEVYWRQVAPFKGKEILAQNSGKQASLINSIAAIRIRAGKLSDARRLPQWNTLVRRTGRLLLSMPLWRLQRVGDELLECFYPNRLIDGAIRLKPGVAACFALQFPVVQALVQMAWLRLVQRLPHNNELIGHGGDLSEFLFGADRNVLGPLSEGLADLQQGVCFYCQAALRGGGHVDHFIPWVRYPRDLGHNFVLTHDRCNGAKGDRLAALPHLDRWLERNIAQRSELDGIFAKVRVLYDAATSTQVAAWSYESVDRAGGLVWSEGDHLVYLRRDWRKRFESEIGSR
jgi:hypothetical protein